MKTTQALNPPPKGPYLPAGASPQAQQPPSNVQLAIVNLGDIIFHNKWFHSAGIGPTRDAKPGLKGDETVLTINLISPGGMGKGFTMVGTKEEITQVYTSLMQQVGTISPRSLMGDHATDANDKEIEKLAEGRKRWDKASNPPTQPTQDGGTPTAKPAKQEGE